MKPPIHLFATAALFALAGCSLVLDTDSLRDAAGDAAGDAVADATVDATVDARFDGDSPDLPCAPTTLGSVRYDPVSSELEVQIDALDCERELSVTDGPGGALVANVTVGAGREVFVVVLGSQPLFGRVNPYLDGVELAVEIPPTFEFSPTVNAPVIASVDVANDGTVAFVSGDSGGSERASRWELDGVPVDVVDVASTQIRSLTLSDDGLVIGYIDASSKAVVLADERLRLDGYSGIDLAGVAGTGYRAALEDSAGQLQRAEFTTDADALMPEMTRTGRTALAGTNGMSWVDSGSGEPVAWLDTACPISGELRSNTCPVANESVVALGGCAWAWVGACGSGGRSLVRGSPAATMTLREDLSVGVGLHAAADDLETMLWLDPSAGFVFQVWRLGEEEPLNRDDGWTTRTTLGHAALSRNGQWAAFAEYDAGTSRLLRVGRVRVWREAE